MSEEGTYWLIILAVIALVFWALVRDNTRARNRTRQEYEEDVLRAKDSLMRAGMLELDMFSGNTKAKRAAVAYQKDEEQGQTKTGGNDDEVDRTDADSPDADSLELEEASGGPPEPVDAEAASIEPDQTSVGDSTGRVEDDRGTGRSPRARLRRDQA